MPAGVVADSTAQPAQDTSGAPGGVIPDDSEDDQEEEDPSLSGTTAVDGEAGLQLGEETAHEDAEPEIPIDSTSRTE
jgi:hypothetical protein